MTVRKCRQHGRTVEIDAFGADAGRRLRRARRSCDRRRATSRIAAVAHRRRRKSRHARYGTASPGEHTVSARGLLLGIVAGASAGYLSRARRPGAPRVARTVAPVHAGPTGIRAVSPQRSNSWKPCVVRPSSAPFAYGAAGEALDRAVQPAPALLRPAILLRRAGARDGDRGTSRRIRPRLHPRAPLRFERADARRLGRRLREKRRALDRALGGDCDAFRHRRAARARDLAAARERRRRSAFRARKRGRSALRAAALQRVRAADRRPRAAASRASRRVTASAMPRFCAWT